jgi:hypothetical protein
LLVVLLAVAWLAVALPVPPAAHADAILCPPIELMWGVTSPLPDPWSSTNQVATQPTKRAVLVKGKEMIVCDYGTGPWTKPLTAYVRRPQLQGVSIKDIDCPAQTMRVGHLGPSLPAPWMAVSYTLPLVEKRYNVLAGQTEIMCTYRTSVPEPYVGPSSILRPLVLEYPQLAATPKPDTTPKDLKNPFGVSAVLHAQPPAHTGACPVKVRFQGSLTASGPGDVKYRWVSMQGAKGPVGTLTFAKAGETRQISTEITVGAKPGSPGLATPGARPGPTPGTALAPTPGSPAIGGLQARSGSQPPAAGGTLATPTVPNKHSGGMKIEIVSPGGSASNEAWYSVVCQTPPPGSLSGAPRPRP